MKIEFIANASFLITFKNGKTLLTDPWFENSCFYGAWHNWPPLVDKEK